VGRDTRRLRLVVALLLLTAFTFLTLDARSGHGAFGGVRRVLGDVFGPVERAVSGVTSPIGRAFSSAFHSGRDDKRIRTLQQQNAALRQTINGLGQAQKDKASLDQLSYGEFRGQYKTVMAHVVANGAPVSDLSQTVTIDVGSMDGIKVDMPVVASDDANGLVGQVVAVDRSTSTIRLITDRNLQLGVTFPDRAKPPPAFVQGAGPGAPLRLTVADPQAGLQPGLTLYTREQQALPDFPAIPGLLPVGTVTRVTTQVGDNQATADVKPFSDPAKLDVVGVVVAPPRQLARVPISPVPSPTPPAPPATTSPTPSASVTPSTSATLSATPRTGTTTTSAPAVTRSASPTHSPSPAQRSASPTARRTTSPTPTARRTPASPTAKASTSPAPGP
jgi:rod shape-determining protein MreC